jgi:tetratricopeptide (TPR) repeat protein
VSAYLSGHHIHAGGHVPIVRTLAQRVEAIAESLGDAPLQIAAHYYLAAAAHLSGDYRGTEHLCRNLIESLHGQRTRKRFGLVTAPAVFSRAQLARALAERGVFDEGEALGHEAIRIAEELDHPFSVVVGCLDLAYLESIRGNLSQAVHLLERAIAQCHEWNLTSHTPVVMAFLGYAYARSGRVAEGASSLQEALTALEGAGIGFHRSLTLAHRGEAALLADQIENARASADRAVTLARERGERGNEAWALRLLGDIASHRAVTDVARATAHYSAAMSLASELEMRPLLAHSHRGLGKLCGRTGQLEQAQRHIRTATTMYREMGMRFYLEQAEAEISA